MIQDSKKKNKWREAPEIKHLYFDVSASDRAKFKAICKARMRSMSSIIRDIMREFIARNEHIIDQSKSGSRGARK